jgi:fucose 4-O-acetylase-like acetyltransferase
MNRRMAAQVAGLLGGVAWLVTAFLWEGGDDPIELGLFWAGAVLVTLFLLELGTLQVKRGATALRVFVAVALPLLFWMVVSFAASSMSDDGVVWGVAGAAVLVLAVVQLARPASRRATL